MQGLLQRDIAPTPEQEIILRNVIDRIIDESEDLRAQETRRDVKGPLLGLLLGRPGAGKTLVLRWIRELFEQVLGWEHCKEFIYVVFQYKTAAMIGGCTLHAAADLAQSEEAGDRSVAGADIGNLYDRNQYLRWIWIDELSMLGTVLLARFEEKSD